MTDHSAALAKGHHRAPRLLIADDDPVVSSTLCHQLSHEFDIVASARDATEAIALAGEHQPDVAIIDVQMPGGGGLRATREIHTCAPQTAIVVLSGDESRRVVLAMLEAGAVTYVRKGVSGHELARTLHRAMEAHANLATT
jgi:DNA-binding NarL/FixJ family response regulator